MKTIILRFYRIVFLITSVSFFSLHSAMAAERPFKPFVSLSEEVTDNVFEQTNNKRTEYITRLRPGATLIYQSPLWSWDASYTFDYRNYARNSHGDEYNHDVALKGNIALVENFFYLDLSDTYHRVSLDVSRTPSTESSLFLNQTDQNVASISPYLIWRLRGDNSLKTGYRFTDTRYRGNGIDRQEHNGYADLTHEISSKLNISAGYAFTRLESRPIRYNQHNLYGGFRYEYADKSFIHATLGENWQHFDTGSDVSYASWNAGITHDFSFVVATVETSAVTSADPNSVSTKETTYNGKLERAFQRGMMGASTYFSEYMDTTNDRILQRKLGFTATGRYEVLPSLTPNIAVTVERFSVTTTTLPYLFSLNAGLDYAFNYDMSFNLNYTYFTKRNDLGNSTGSIDVNKVVVEIKKAF